MNIINCSKKFLVILCVLFLTTSLVKANPLTDKQKAVAVACFKAGWITLTPKDAHERKQTLELIRMIYNAPSVGPLGTLQALAEAVQEQNRKSIWKYVKAHGSRNWKKYMLLTGIVAFATATGVPVISTSLFGHVLNRGMQLRFMSQGYLVQNYLIGLMCLPTSFDLLGKLYDRYCTR